VTVTSGCCLENEILAWWSATPELEALLPAADVFTDNVQDPDHPTPYVVIDNNSEVDFQTSSATAYRGLIAFEVFYGVDDYSLGRQLATQLKCSFPTFKADSECIKGNCPEYVADERNQTDEGKRRFLVSFTLRYSIIC
jgi:hypothetical protein